MVVMQVRCCIIFVDTGLFPGKSMIEKVCLSTDFVRWQPANERNFSLLFIALVNAFLLIVCTGDWNIMQTILSKILNYHKQKPKPVSPKNMLQSRSSIQLLSIAKQFHISKN